MNDYTNKNYNNENDNSSKNLGDSDTAGNSFSGRWMSRSVNNNSSSALSSLGIWKTQKKEDRMEEDELLVHDLKVGDHVIRWSHVALYPIQIHGIVLETSPLQVSIVDFGYTRQDQEPEKNKQQQQEEEDSAMMLDRKQEKSSNRFHIRTLRQSSDVNKWHKIAYGDEDRTSNKNKNSIMSWAKNMIASNQKPKLSPSQSNNDDIEMTAFSLSTEKESITPVSIDPQQPAPSLNISNNGKNNINDCNHSKRPFDQVKTLSSSNTDGKTSESRIKNVDQTNENNATDSKKQQPTMYVKSIGSGHSAISNYDIVKNKKTSSNPYSLETNARIANIAKMSASRAWSSASPWLQKARDMTTTAAYSAAQPLQQKFFPSNNKSTCTNNYQNNNDSDNTVSTSSHTENSDNETNSPNDQQPSIPKSDPKLLVMARVAFLLESEQKDLNNNIDKDVNNEKKNPNHPIIPPYHAFLSNSECIAVWCKTGRWSTFQASVFLYSTAIGNGKQMIMGLASATAVSPMLLPVVAGFGALYIGAPYLYLHKCKSEWEKITHEMNDKFWAQAQPELFVSLIQYAFAQKNDAKGTTS